VAWVLSLLAVAAIAGVAVWLATRAHHGNGKLAITPPTVPRARALTQVSLCTNCAHGYNPLGNPKDETPNAGLAIDNQTDTYWSTQIYYDGRLNKTGTGIYLDASPGTAARVLRVLTNNPGFSATVYASNSQPAYRWPDSAWTQVSAPTTIRRQQSISLTSGHQRYRYWLLWITNLGSNHRLQLDELTLYR
jgi:serine/threonine-protein kinase